MEIPQIIKNTSDFMRDPIKSLNVNINSFNNINDPSLNTALNIKKISTIQDELLNNFKLNMKFNLLSDKESKKIITVAHKEVPIIKRENIDNPNLSWDSLS